MRRAVLLLMLSLLLGQAVGLAEVLGGDACESECDDDAAGRQCPPVCPTCACSVRPVSLLPASEPMMALLPESVSVAFCEADRTPAVPEPREILHVPIAARV